ncbi:hypothetical protein KJ359_009362 [Pestalotiopsis sp. 9143b]|nr:hypothetical protein KJ359_009362 [Pestalotiopsis sp. 9143b]
MRPEGSIVKTIPNVEFFQPHKQGQDLLRLSHVRYLESPFGASIHSILIHQWNPELAYLVPPGHHLEMWCDIMISIRLRTAHLQRDTVRVVAPVYEDPYIQEDLA